MIPALKTKVVDRPTDLRGPRTDAALDDLAQAVIALPEGKALAIEIPAGAAVKKFRSSIGTGLRRRFNDGSTGATSVSADGKTLFVWKAPERHHRSRRGAKAAPAREPAPEMAIATVRASAKTKAEDAALGIMCDQCGYEPPHPDRTASCPKCNARRWLQKRPRRMVV